jgi:hypothetical protein
VTTILAIVVAVIVPVSSLKLVGTVATCCCPDPSDCHCPHDKQPSDQSPAMRTCHRVDTTFVTPDLPGFEPAHHEPATAPARVVASVSFAIDPPHAAPSLERPAAPS